MHQDLAGHWRSISAMLGELLTVVIFEHRFLGIRGIQAIGQATWCTNIGYAKNIGQAVAIVSWCRYHFQKK
jgi:hypothetical protein